MVSVLADAAGEDVRARTVKAPTAATGRQTQVPDPRYSHWPRGMGTGIGTLRDTHWHDHGNSNRTVLSHMCWCNIIHVVWATQHSKVPRNARMPRSHTRGNALLLQTLRLM